MILETVRILADWVDDATYGVNVHLATVPRETGVTLPSNVDVRDETRDPQCARDQIPDDLTGNGLLVSAYEGADQTNPANRPWPPDASVTVLMRFATTNKDTDTAACDSSVTLRALWKCLGQLMTTSAGETARTRQSVQLLHIESMRLLASYTPATDVTVTGAALVSCRVRDLYAGA